MIDYFRRWYERHFADEEAVVLVVFAAVMAIIIWQFGGILMPVLAAILIAYILAPIVDMLGRYISLTWATSIVTLVFLGVCVLAFLVVVPLIWQQLYNLLSDIPKMVNELEKGLVYLQGQYPEVFGNWQLNQALGQLDLTNIGAQITPVISRALTLSFSSITTVLTAAVYLIIIPILVFFFLKDRALFWQGFTGLLPKKRNVLNYIAREMDQQAANYLRGKAVEILIVGASALIVFKLFGLQYSALLAIAVGLSVLVPYVGAVLVSLPVALVALLQFGLTPEFYGVVIAYMVLQALDGNVLVPILFSEAVSLHPASIIIAVLFFGGLWGFWGVFFAIPLATLVKATFNAWPSNRDDAAQDG